LTFKDLSKEKS